MDMERAAGERAGARWQLAGRVFPGAGYGRSMPTALSGLSSSASAQARLTPPRLGLSSSALRAEGSTSRLAERSDTWLGVELGS